MHIRALWHQFAVLHVCFYSNEVTLGGSDNEQVNCQLATISMDHSVGADCDNAGRPLPPEITHESLPDIVARIKNSADREYLSEKLWIWREWYD